MIILTEHDKIYKDLLGIVKYHDVIKDREEYMETDDNRWNLFKRWVSIDEIRAFEKFKDNGKVIIKKFLATLPKNVGVLANPVPIDNDISFTSLRNWYIAQGFKKWIQQELLL
jgi:hypothetical protein